MQMEEVYMQRMGEKCNKINKSPATTIISSVNNGGDQSWHYQIRWTVTLFAT